MAIPKDPASRAYLQRFAPTMLGYVVLVLLTPWLIRTFNATGPLLWALAILPALPIIAVFVLVGRYWLELRDEFIRLLEIRKALIATGVTMSLATAWGFLEIYADAPHIPTFYVPVVWFGGLGFGACVNKLIERGGGE